MVPGVLVKEDKVTPRSHRVLVVPKSEGAQVVFSAKSAKHVEAGGAIAVKGVEVVIGHDDGVPLAVIAAVLGPDGFCALFEISVVAVRGLDSFLNEVVLEVLDVDAVLAEADEPLVWSEGVCWVAVFGVKETVFCED